MSGNAGSEMSVGIRFTSPGLPGIQLIRQSTAQPPVDQTVCLVDDGHAAGWHRQPVTARYQDGAWSKPNGRPLPFVPTFWTVVEELSDDA